MAIVGGGCAALSAAFELTRPELGHRFDVTVYQMGWRLGGKGASGRGTYQRIEEHGLHLWMGYYENAFRLLRECYAELRRDPRTQRFADWSDAFFPAHSNVAMDSSPSAGWVPWHVHFPPAPGLPGDPDPPCLTLAGYLARAASLVRTLLETLQYRGGSSEKPAQGAPPPAFARSSCPPREDELAAAIARLLRQGSLAGLGVAIEATRLLELTLGTASYPQSAAASLLALITSILQRQVDALVRGHDELRRMWEVADLVLAVIRGAVRFRLLFDRRGLDALDEYDCREWLELNGASRLALDSAFLRAMYDLAFAYEGGDPSRPRIAAGSALRGAMRAFFTYRGAFFWKMRAGMGDVVFAPLYEVLSRRGVRFEFFHKLRQLRLGEPSRGEEPFIEALEFDVQAQVRQGTYQPLIDAAGLPSWPARPDYGQLVEGERLADEGWDLESQWDSRRVAEKTLRVGRHFDLVVLGVGIGVIPHVCSDLIARDERWRNLVQRVRGVPTQAFQLWLNRPMADFGWTAGPTNLSGFVEPFDTWADMTHLASEEAWSRPPMAIAYFCNVLSEGVHGQIAPMPGDPTGGEYIRSRQQAVRDSAVAFLNTDVHHLWPRASSPSGGFRWDSLAVEAAGAEAAGEERFDSQFWTANVRPSDLYSQALPGSTPYRISPLDRAYDNLTVAGDWTSCSLNMGCVEAAVMSGRLAAHAIAQRPALEEIFGYDHP